MTNKKRDPLRLRYCPKCGIVTVGRKSAPCFGIVMKFRHPKAVTRMITFSGGLKWRTGAHIAPR